MIRTGYQNFVRTAIVAYTDIQNRLKLLEINSLKNEKNYTDMINQIKSLNDKISSLENELQKQKCECQGAKMSQLNDKNLDLGMMA